MGEESTSMRDIIFYQHHTYVEELFTNYKYKFLKPYEQNQLVLPGINITSLSVQSDNNLQTNTLETFWNAKEFNLSRGLDYNPDKKPYNNNNSFVC